MIFVFGFDADFAMPTGVAVRSLDRHLRRSDRILLLHDGVPAGALSDVRACASQAEVSTVDCGAMLKRAWVPSDHLSRAAYLRYLAPEILSGESRCVYLDGDVVVRSDPSALHDHDLQDATLGAVRSRVAPFAASHGGIMRWFELGIPSTAPYFNSGVYVADLVRWRDRDVTGRITTFLEAYGSDTYIADQEALNVAVAADWVELDRTWNYVTHVTESFLQQPELEPTDPNIVHFAGRLKPWSFGRPPLFAEEWHAIKAETPWADFVPTAPPPLRGARAAARRTVGRALRQARRVMREQ